MERCDARPAPGARYRERLILGAWATCSLRDCPTPTLAARACTSGEPRWCPAGFVLGGNDRPGVCAGLGYASPPGFRRCHRRLLASLLSRRHRVAHAFAPARTASFHSAVRASRISTDASAGGSGQADNHLRAWRSADRLAERRRHRAPLGVDVAGCCPARGGVIDAYSSAVNRPWRDHVAQ